MGLFTSLISGTVKAVITPVAIVKDIVNVAKGDEPEATKKLLKSANEDFKKFGDNLCGIE